MALDKAGILNCIRLKTELVKIDEENEVIVSEIGAADYIKLWTDEANRTDGEIDMAKFTPALVAYAVVDEQSQRIFTDEEVKLLARASHGPFMAMAAAARRLNGLSGDDSKN